MPPPFRCNQDNFRLALPPPLSLTHTPYPYMLIHTSRFQNDGGVGGVAGSKFDTELVRNGSACLELIGFGYPL